LDTGIFQMKWNKFYIFFLLAGFPLYGIAQTNQQADSSIIEFSGVIMTADSLQAIPGVSIAIKGTDRGTTSNDEGVFTIVAYKGNVIHFSAVGFQPKDVKIPPDLKGNHFSMIQLMVTDTVYLPETIIRPYPSPEEFAREFVDYKFPDDKYEIARKNTEAAKLRALAFNLPLDGQEATSMYLNQQAQRISYAGQMPPENIFNPLAWAQFIQAWKNGDFKNKD
jgi:CarboxypepD_reg-like domain